MKKITARVDPDLADLIPGYLDNRAGDLHAMRAALETGDLQPVHDLAHSMKGSGGGYGFNGLTELGAVLEQAAKRHDAPEVARRLEEMALYLERVEVVYD